MMALLISCAAGVIGIVYLIVTYNDCMSGEDLVADAWCEVEMCLKKRQDLIPELVEMLQSRGTHQRSLYQEIKVARIQSMNASGDMAAQARAEFLLSCELNNLLAVAENNNELVRNDEYLRLRTELAGLDEVIRQTCRFYNKAAGEQNKRISQFPCNLVASVFRFEHILFFELEHVADNRLSGVGIWNQ